MIKSTLRIRVRYSETDRMGFVYYGNYASYFEVARVEMLRDLGLTYKEMEDTGIILPVLDFKIRYLKPAYYDDLLEIKTTMSDLPQARMKFDYETFNSEGTLLNIAECVLVFVSTENYKPCGAPDYFLDKLRPLFS